MIHQTIAVLEKHGFLEIERTISFLVDVYILTHRDATPDQALNDLDSDIKAMVGARYQCVIDIAWKYLSPALRPIIQSAIDTALAADGEGAAIPQPSGGQTAA